MKLRGKVWLFFDRTLEAMAYVAGIIVALTMVGINVEIVARYFWGRPIDWMDEVCGYSLLYLTFLAAPWLLREDGHVTMDFVLNRISTRQGYLLNAFTSGVGALICLIVMWYSARSTWDHFQLGYAIPSLLHPPIALILVVIPVGFFMLFIQFLRRTYGYVEGWRASLKLQ